MNLNLIKQQYLANGFTIIKGAVKKNKIDVVKKFLSTKKKDEIFKLRKKIKAKNNQEFIRKIKIIKKQNQLKKFYTEEEIKCIAGEFPLKIRLSKIYLKIFNNEIKKIFRDIIGTKDLFVHWPPVSRFVLPKNTTAAVPAHFDKMYNSHLKDFFTCWIPLVKIDKKCGGMKFFLTNKFNHKINKINKRDVKKKIWLDKLNTRGLKSIKTILNPGDLIIFNKNLIHESLPNKSNYTRYSLDFRFFGKAKNSKKTFYSFKNKKLKKK